MADRDLVDDGDADPERQGRPEVVSVELQRLGDELPDRAGLGRKRWRQLALAHAEDATATQPREHLAKRRECLVEPPERPVGLADLVRDDAHLDRGDARELAGAQDREALHRLDVDVVGAADACARPDRQHARVGKRSAEAGEQVEVGQRSRDSTSGPSASQ